MCALIARDLSSILSTSTSMKTIISCNNQGGRDILECYEGTLYCIRCTVWYIGCMDTQDAWIHNMHGYIRCMHKIYQQNDEDKLTSVLATLDPNTRHAITRSAGSKSSSWLTVLPIALHHFDLSATEFRDSLALRYHRPLLKAPAKCDGCGDVFNMTHALDCRKGGLVIQRHNEVRDALGDLASLVYKDVIHEPTVQEANDVCGIPSLVADLSIRGVWQSQTVALFDIRVIDTDALSYLHRDVASVLSSTEEEKKRKYNDAAEARRASFTPLVVSVDGALGREAECFIQLLADRIAQKWKKKPMLKLQDGYKPGCPLPF